MSVHFAFSHECVILDACCAITLYESGHMTEILRAIGKQVVIASYVHDEEVLRADLQPLIDAGLLVVVSPDNESEEITYVNFAVELDDGEAVSGALAVHRDWSIATDEVKAITFFTREVPQVQLVSTPDLIKHWVDTTNPPLDVVRTAIQNVRTKARYEPRSKHPLRDWWRTYT